MRIKYNNKFAFTLAEVLVTLAIIGVIAALTIPSVIQQHRNMEVEAKLKKIYSEMNQAIKLSEFNNGGTSSWDAELKTVEGIRTYILPYLQATKIEEEGNYIYIHLNNGSILAKDKEHIGNWAFITRDSNDCKDRSKNIGICIFEFYYHYAPNNAPSSAKGLFEPYDYSWDGTREGLMHNKKNWGCGDTYRSYCTKLIQYNGWKIPKDYPHRVK